MLESAPHAQGVEEAVGRTAPLERNRRTVPQRAAAFLARSSRGTVGAVCVLLLLVIGWLDYLTSYEISLLAFYWIPIALATWYLGARTGYLFAVASVATAIGTDLAAGFIPSHRLVLLWAVSWELLSFAALVWLVAKLKEYYLEALRTSQLEIALRASQAAFEELQGFGYVIGHNWRAPLRSIDGYSQILLQEYGRQIDAQGRAYLQRLCASSRQMAELTNALLELIKFSGGELRWEPTDLSAVAEAIAAMLSRDNPSPAVAFTCEPELFVMGDRHLLSVALERLMNNAWKFTRQQPTPTVTFGATRQKEGLVYFLRDNGVGFSTAQAQRLFMPYETAHRQDEFAGVGIGLPIAQRIIHRHGGQLWAEGAEGQGATFYFTLGRRP